MPGKTVVSVRNYNEGREPGNWVKQVSLHNYGWETKKSVQNTPFYTDFC